MIVLITGASHTGKTSLAQRLLERYKYPYLSIDLLKMGLIRSGTTTLTPYDDNALTDYLWSIVKEIVKTAVENDQDLIVEGCYIPFDWKKDLDEMYLSRIKYICLIFSEKYTREHFEDIVKYANVIENRIDDSDLMLEAVIRDNQYFLKNCDEYGLDYVLIDDNYGIEIQSALRLG